MKFLTFTVNKKPYAISLDYIAGYEDYKIYVKRNSYFMITVDQDFNEIQKIINESIEK